MSMRLVVLLATLIGLVGLAAPASAQLQDVDDLCAHVNPTLPGGTVLSETFAYGGTNLHICTYTRRPGLRPIRS